MFHVYVDAADVEVLTPSYHDAERFFRKYIREYPTNVVDFDELKNAVPPHMSESGELEHDGRTRIMQSQPK